MGAWLFDDWGGPLEEFWLNSSPVVAGNDGAEGIGCEGPDGLATG